MDIRIFFLPFTAVPTVLAALIFRRRLWQEQFIFFRLSKSIAIKGKADIYDLIVHKLDTLF